MRTSSFRSNPLADRKRLGQAGNGAGYRERAYETDTDPLQDEGRTGRGEPKLDRGRVSGIAGKIAGRRPLPRLEAGRRHVRSPRGS